MELYDGHTTDCVHYCRVSVTNVLVLISHDLRTRIDRSAHRALQTWVY